jgi:hypothetical protein
MARITRFSSRGLTGIGIAGAPLPTYSVAAGSPAVGEGVSLTFTVTTTLVPDATVLFWTVSRPADFATSSGSVTITAGTGTFSVTPTADLTTEGLESFTASVRIGSITGTIAATSSSVNIIDLSTTP